jgi:hypothetical protein
MDAERALLEDQVNESCERVMRDFLAAQVRELDAFGMGHIPYAVRARRCLAAFDEHLGELEAPTRPAGRPHLRIVG